MGALRQSTLESLLWFAFLVYAALGAYAFRQRRQRAALCFGLAMMLSAVWAWCYAMEIANSTLSGKLAWMQCKQMGLPFLPVLFLAVVMQVASVAGWFRPWIWVAWCIVPAVSSGLALTLRYHTLMRYDFTLQTVGDVVVLGYQRGPWEWVHETYTNLLCLLLVVILLAAWHGATRLVRKQILWLAAVIALRLGLGLLFLFTGKHSQGINPAVLTLLPSSLVLAWLVFYTRMVNLAPIARSLLMDHIREGVVVLDLDGRIQDLNAAAARMLEVPLAAALRRKTDVFPQAWHKFFRSNAPEQRTERVLSGGATAWIEVSAVDIRDGPNGSVGRLHLLRDRTSELQEKETLLRAQKAEEEQKVLLQQQRLVRDLHDGLAGLMTNISLLAARTGPPNGEPERALLLDRIGDLALEAGAELRELMSSLETRQLLWADVIDETRRHGTRVIEPAGLAFSLVVEGQVPCQGPGPSAGLSLLRALREAMNNAVKHARAKSLSVRFAFAPDGCQLEVTDDGAGLTPPAAGRGRGLRNMRQRIEELAGAMTVATAAGTRVRFDLPLPLPLPLRSPAPPAAHEGTGAGQFG
jgi:signal transduction histidine kinase